MNKAPYVCGTCGRALASENFLEVGSFRTAVFGKTFPSESLRGGRGSSTGSTGFIFFFLIFTGGGLKTHTDTKLAPSLRRTVFLHTCKEDRTCFTAGHT